MVARRTARAIWTTSCFFDCSGEKVVQRVPFRKPWKWKMAPTKQLFVKVRHWDPLKAVLGSGFENTRKTKKHYRKINSFWWSKTIEKYWKTISFLKFWSFPKTMKKPWQRGSRQSFFGSRIVTWASQVRLIFWFPTFWCDAPKWCFLDALPLV